MNEPVTVSFKEDSQAVFRYALRNFTILWHFLPELNLIICYAINIINIVLIFSYLTQVFSPLMKTNPYGVFFSTKKCALYYKKFTFVFVSSKCFSL